MNWSVSWFVRRSDGGEDQMQVAGEIAIGSYIDAGGGRDQVQTGNGADSIYGGDGEDQIQTGGGNDFVDAGAGNDQVQTTGGHNILLGGAGNDQVQGGNGRDLIVGGTGADKLIGQDNDDILVAGYTDHDGNIANLKAIHAEWLTGASFSTRLNNIKFGGGLNGSVLLDDATVHDDGTADELTGSNGTDWFFYNQDGDNDATRDRVTDASSVERLNWVDIDFTWA